MEDEAVNFNSVHNRSGVSKNYLYNEPEIRKSIEEWLATGKKQFNCQTSQI